MITSNMHEAKTNLSQLIKAVQGGTEVVIAKAGKPVARLVTYQPKINARKAGFWEGKIEMSEDFFEETAEVNELFYGKA